MDQFCVYAKSSFGLPLQPNLTYGTAFGYVLVYILNVVGRKFWVNFCSPR